MNPQKKMAKSIEDMERRIRTMSNELSNMRQQLAGLRKSVRMSMAKGPTKGWSASETRCLDAVCEVWSVDPGQVMGNRKFRYLIEPRHAYVTLMVEEEGLEYTQTAHGMCRHHTSAMHSHRTARDCAATDSEFADKMRRARELVRKERAFSLENPES